FTCVRVQMTMGRPRPLPGYPTTPALNPVSVRRVRVQGPQLPSDPTSRWAPLPGLAVPVITARSGLAPLTFTTCLARNAQPAWPEGTTRVVAACTALSVLAALAIGSRLERRQLAVGQRHHVLAPIADQPRPSLPLADGVGLRELLGAGAPSVE